MIPETKSWRRNREGHLIHDGDCMVFAPYHVCTCGLLHHLMPYPVEAGKERPEWGEEIYRHDDALRLLAEHVKKEASYSFGARRANETSHPSGATKETPARQEAPCRK